MLTVLGESIPDRGKSRCKDPEVGNVPALFEEEQGVQYGGCREKERGRGLRERAEEGSRHVGPGRPS